MLEPISRQLPSRRALVAGGLTLGVTACLSDRSAAPRSGDGVPESDEERLDRAYERLHAYRSDDVGFLSNHVPMVCEALAELGRADAIPAWLDRNLHAPPGSGAEEHAVEPARWREAVGDRARLFDWRALFVSELERRPFGEVLATWAPRLVPGLAGAATHGVIRTAHAVRALARRDSGVRRLELATALAYWASRFEELPWDGSESPSRTVDEALARLAPRRGPRPAPGGSIVAGLRSLHGDPSFLPAAGLLDVEDPPAALSTITAAFARIYLKNPEHRIAFTHSVTAPSAIRLLAPWLDEETRRRAARHAWQAAAGLYHVFDDPRAEEPVLAPAGTEEVVARAVRGGQHHGIKLTEACLRENAARPDPVYLLAATDASLSLRG